MKVRELRAKLRHYPPDMEVMLLFGDIKENATVPWKSFYKDHFCLKKYDHTQKLFILPKSFNEKYLDIYERFIEMKQIAENYEEE